MYVCIIKSRLVSHLKIMVSEDKDTEQEKFGIIDLLRVFSGILFFNCILSYFLTSSTTWGYEGKWIDPHYWSFMLSNDYLNLTIDELSLYNGTDPKLPIYVGVYGKVYDVTRSKHVYGPKGAYGFFSGKDAARAFSTGCFNKPDEFTYDLRGLDHHDAMQDIEDWQKFFENNDKYWYVGTVIHEPLTGEPPLPCEHMKFPGSGPHGKKK